MGVIGTLRTCACDRRPLVCATLVACGLGGCGGGHSETARTHHVQPPTRPTSGQCGELARLLPTTARPQVDAPAPGTYRLRTVARVTPPGGGAPRSLHGETRVLVTAAREAGHVRCFRVQRRLLGGAVETATFAVRGSDVYSTDYRYDNGRDTFFVEPAQPVRTVAGGELEWQGQFTADTHGTVGDVRYQGPAQSQYAAAIVGRRRMKVGSESIPVVGVELRASFAGEDVTRTERSTRWVSLRRNLVIAEDVVENQHGGGRTLRQRYRSHLVTLDPG